MLYVTPQQFRRMPLGNDLGAINDEQLSRALELATSEVNRYCAAPKSPAPHDFRGSSVTAEQHIWDLGNNYRRGSDRVYPFHGPVSAVSVINLRLTPDQYVAFQPADIYVNNAEGWLEVVSLARRLSVFSAGYVPLLGLLQPVAELSYSYGYSFPIIDERFWPDDNLKVFRGQNQWWTADPVTVKRNGTLITTGFTLDANEGTVTFAAAENSANVITVSYTHRLPWEIRDATGLVASNALISKAYVAAGFSFLQGVKVEETELRFDRKKSFNDGLVDGRAAQLLDGYRFRSWGGE